MISTPDGKFIISIFSSKPTERREKGKSLLTFIDSYTAIDLETTGLSPEWDEVIELTALRVRDCKVVAKFSRLVKPEEEIPRFITKLTGITNKDVECAPKIEAVLPKYLDFIGEDIVVGHNVNFDVNFLYDLSMRILDQPFSNDLIDTYRYSRHVLPGLPHYKLRHVAQALDITPDRTHRSEADAMTAYKIYEAIKTKFPDFKVEAAKYTSFIDPKANEVKENPESALYGATCVITGTLEKMNRATAEQIIMNIGGRCASSVSRKTDFLILGNNDYKPNIKDGKSTKQKKAEQLIAEGADINIIPENVFYDMIW